MINADVNSNTVVPNFLIAKEILDVNYMISFLYLWALILRKKEL